MAHPTKRKKLRMIVTVDKPDSMTAAEARRLVRRRLELITVLDEPVELCAVQAMPRDFAARRRYQPRQGIPPLLREMGVEK